jgi:hypothetical protein
MVEATQAGSGSNDHGSSLQWALARPSSRSVLEESVAVRSDDQRAVVARAVAAFSVEPI